MVKVLKLFFMFLLPAAVAKFEFSTPQSEVSTFLHTSVFLPCYFTVAKSRNGLNFVIVNWRHNDLELAQYMDDEVKTKTGRVVLLESELHRGNASLILKDVAISDEGNYECEVIEAPNIASGKIRLKVRVVPQLSVKQSKLVINQTSVLECRAEDFYPGNISMEWMRDFDPLPAQRPPLIYHHRNGTFSSVIQYNYTPTSEDIKVPVYCRVKYAPQEQKNITLEICYPVFNWSPKTLLKGTIVNATCKLLGCQFSKVTVSWNKGNERLNETFCKEKKECETTVEIQTPSTGQDKKVQFVCKAELEDFETPLVEHINFPTQGKK
ncbi:uncharacterized protein LOC127529813 [Erpetoichthys calabaricus]|uniref:uncharacterized protein LOC127529813 n=1 Tax=Erpetoichthys calabaricus TaxID=27687 RepID=UPI002233EF36|nr:uncharacterized protein LOC127529813 [Erpetoichthys calabaricus]